jgi:hypothetical protein
VNQLDDGADLVGPLGEGVDFMAETGFGGEGAGFGDLGGRLTARQRDVGGFDGFVFSSRRMPAISARLPCALVSELPKALIRWTMARLPVRSRRAESLCRSASFSACRWQFQPAAAFALIEARRSASSRSNVVLLIHI